MATASFSLWLLLVGSLMSQLCCQHWSYGLSPGGKRDVDHLSDSVDTVVVSVPHAETSSALLGCVENAAAFSRIFGIKEILNSRTDRRAKRFQTSNK
uniref:Progonadoliberin-1 n=1 Tax=Takifugu rubripes TaxID=31033 RepID=A0A173MSD5_TAKRU|nr:progonadoliberin-1 precursor [Takifugu rubripes]